MFSQPSPTAFPSYSAVNATTYISSYPPLGGPALRTSNGSQIFSIRLLNDSGSLTSSPFIDRFRVVGSIWNANWVNWAALMQSECGRANMTAVSIQSGYRGSVVVAAISQSPVAGSVNSYNVTLLTLPGPVAGPSASV